MTALSHCDRCAGRKGEAREVSRCQSRKPPNAPPQQDHHRFQGRRTCVGLLEGHWRIRATGCASSIRASSTAILARATISTTRSWKWLPGPHYAGLVGEAAYDAASLSRAARSRCAQSLDWPRRTDRLRPLQQDHSALSIGALALHAGRLWDFFGRSREEIAESLRLWAADTRMVDDAAHVPPDREALRNRATSGTPIPRSSSNGCKAFQPGSAGKGDHRAQLLRSCRDERGPHRPLHYRLGALGCIGAFSWER